MYEVKKTETIKEQARFTDSQGNELVINVIINPMVIARKASVELVEVRDLQKKAKMSPNDVRLAEELGDATLRMLETVLGANNTQSLMHFYEEDMLAMVMDVMPFILEVRYPKILASSKEAAKRTRRRHFLNR